VSHREHLMQIDFERLWKRVSADFLGDWTSLHGPSHWRRVERNGLLLATRTQANATVARLFALFHDSRRENDGWDKGHGARGAEFAQSLRGVAYDLTDDEFDLLHYACVWHTDGMQHDDPTIATCWDADRLDLGRVGVRPDPKRMCTSFGREIARIGSVEIFLAGSE
jgi:uncharacterized protein